MVKTDACFVAGGVRTPFFKSMTAYSKVTTKDLMIESLKGLVTKFNLEGQLVGDVALGALMNAPANRNLAREVVQSSGLHAATPGYNVQRACGTSLDTTIQIANKIALGQIENGIAGGTDSMSDSPIMVSRTLAQKILAFRNSKTALEKLKIVLTLLPSDFSPVLPYSVEPRTGLSMGEHAEKMVKEWKVSREEQDLLSLESHKKAAAAYKSGFYNDLVLEFMGNRQDGPLRTDVTLEKLAKLKPAFDKSPNGSLTAGNSTPYTDGSSAVLLTNEASAQKFNWPLLARFVDGQVAAVDYINGEGLLLAPTIAVSQLLLRNQMSLQDFDFYEIHEAFAGQVLCTLKAWESDVFCKGRLARDRAMGPIDRSKMNINGGSLALGHPFAATGSRIVATLAKTISHSNKKSRGLISICTAGGMGVAAIFESV